MGAPTSRRAKRQIKKKTTRVKRQQSHETALCNFEGAKSPNGAESDDGGRSFADIIASLKTESTQTTSSAPRADIITPPTTPDRCIDILFSRNEALPSLERLVTPPDDILRSECLEGKGQTQTWDVIRTAIPTPSFGHPLEPMHSMYLPEALKPSASGESFSEHRGPEYFCFCEKPSSDGCDTGLDTYRKNSYEDALNPIRIQDFRNNALGQDGAQTKEYVPLKSCSPRATCLPFDARISHLSSISGSLSLLSLSSHHSRNNSHDLPVPLDMQLPSLLSDSTFDPVQPLSDVTDAASTHSHTEVIHDQPRSNKDRSLHDRLQDIFTWYNHEMDEIARVEATHEDLFRRRVQTMTYRARFERTERARDYISRPAQKVYVQQHMEQARRERDETPMAVAMRSLGAPGVVAARRFLNAVDRLRKSHSGQLVPEASYHERKGSDKGSVNSQKALTSTPLLAESELAKPLVACSCDHESCEFARDYAARCEMLVGSAQRFAFEASFKHRERPNAIVARTPSPTPTVVGDINIQHTEETPEQPDSPPPAWLLDEPAEDVRITRMQAGLVERERLRSRATWSEEQTNPMLEIQTSEALVMPQSLHSSNGSQDRSSMDDWKKNLVPMTIPMLTYSAEGVEGLEWTHGRMDRHWRSETDSSDANADTEKDEQRRIENDRAMDERFPWMDPAPGNYFNDDVVRSCLARMYGWGTRSYGPS